MKEKKVKIKKLTEQEVERIKEKLKPYWREYYKLEKEFMHKTSKLQKKMSKEMNLGIDLEFFCVDGECAGIGASDYSDREKFPLIHFDFDE